MTLHYLIHGSTVRALRDYIANRLDRPDLLAILSRDSEAPYFVIHEELRQRLLDVFKEEPIDRALVGYQALLQTPPVDFFMPPGGDEPTPDGT